MKDVYQTITDHILASVDDAGDWKPCWHGMMNAIPHNATSGHRYQGVNILTCWVMAIARGYTSQRWASYRQWQAAGAQVRKGERGTPIIFYKQLTSEDPDDDGRIFARASYVFNADQVDGDIAPEPIPELDPAARIAAIDEWIERISNDAIIEHRDEGRAYYRPSQDMVVMPRFSHFHDAEHYYTVLFHELTHWTGAKHRLDREFAARDVDKATYAKEELVAELGAAFLAAEFGIEAKTRDDHTAYIASWLKALRNDKRLIVRAASLASKAADYLHQVAEIHILQEEAA